jgi:predicted outer membrane repeat protein
MVMKKIYTHFYLISACLFFSTSLMRADGHLASDLEANVWYVNIAVQDSVEDGTSWETAFRDLQTAIDAAGSDDEIWIAKGEYTAVQAYFIDKGLKMYGGFAGTETTKSERNISSYNTFIQGDTTGNPNSTLMEIQLSRNAQMLLDGIGFRYGFSFENGGAIQAKGDSAFQSSLKINACFFLLNESFQNGGAIGAEDIELIIMESLFENNFSDGHGGAIYYQSPTYATQTALELTSCNFFENSSKAQGGAVFIKGLQTVERFEIEIIDSNIIIINKFEEYVTSKTKIQNCSFLLNTSFFDIGSVAEGGGAIHFQGMKVGSLDPMLPDLPEYVFSSILEIGNSEFGGNTSLERGGAISFEGEARISNNIYASNRTLFNSGGAISGKGFMTLDSSYFEFNEVILQGNGASGEFELQGGAIFFQPSFLWYEHRIRKSTFTQNTANLGGAIALSDFQTFPGYVSSSPRANMLIEDCDFIENVANGIFKPSYGGAIYINNASPKLRLNRFNDNKALGGYGGAVATVFAGANYTDNEFENNTASFGGALFASNPGSEPDSILIHRNTFTQNQAIETNTVPLSDFDQGKGGGIFSSHPFSKITQSQFTNNTAFGEGGAIYSVEALDLEKVDFIGNRALARNFFSPLDNKGGIGGAIFSEGNLTMTRCQVLDNYATQSTGGIFAENIVISHSLFTNNLADDLSFLEGRSTRFGAALHTQISALVNNCTFFNNVARKSKVQFTNGFTGTINNSIIWSEADTIDPIKDVLSNNSLLVNHCIVNRYFRDIQGTNMRTDPLFVDPDNGDLRLKLCSPGVNGGNTNLVANQFNDLDGQDFIIGEQVDIGAYESSFEKSDFFFVSAENGSSNEFARGVSWDCALPSLTKAIEKAEEENTIWVAKGTYTPDTDPLGNNPPAAPGSQTFYLNKDIEIYGGFAGDEDPETFDLEDRDFVLNQSILSGLGEAYHVVFSEAQSDDAVLDGFIIQDGFSTDSDLLSQNQKQGAGLLGLDTEITLTNLIFQNNEAGAYGGAMAFLGTSTPGFVQNSRFLYNRSKKGGGAIYIENESLYQNDWNANFFFRNSVSEGNGGAISIIGEGDLALSNSIFEENSALQGGALHIDFRGYSFIAGCSFDKNEAIRGGAIYAAFQAFGEGNLPPLADPITECEFPDISYAAVLGNSTFINNQGTIQGGAIYLSSQSGVILGNIGFLNNDAPLGGAIYNNSISQALTLGNVLITESNADDGAAIFSANDFFLFNSTIAGNSVASTGGIISYGQGKALLCSSIIWGNNGTSLLTKSNLGQGLLGYSIVEGGCNNASYEACLTPTHVLDADPMFRNPNMGDFRLTIGSPAIDAGLTSANESDVDLDGQPRVSGNAIDMGAYETQLTTSTETSLTEKKERIHIFPNPANQQLQITFQLPPREEGQIRILNSIGQQVYTTSFKKGVDKLQIELPEAVKSGLYLLTVSSKDVSYSTRLIVARE